MMKKLFLLIFLPFLFTSYLKCQKVDSIKVEQAGDFVKIRYKINNSTSDQKYRVKVLCSINGGMNSEIRSISGDVGDQVSGGKPEYWVVWDVLKDVEDLNSADFIVRAELIRDKANLDTKSHLYIMPVAELGDGILFGGRVSFMGNWGGSARFTTGTRGTEASNYEETYNTSGFSFDLTRKIVNSEKWQLHMMAGIAGSKFETVIRSSTLYSVDLRWGPEIGTCGSVGKIAFSFALTFFPGIVDGKESTTSSVFGNVGVGMKF